MFLECIPMAQNTYYGGFLKYECPPKSSKLDHFTIGTTIVTWEYPMETPHIFHIRKTKVKPAKKPLHRWPIRCAPLSFPETTHPRNGPNYVDIPS